MIGFITLFSVMPWKVIVDARPGGEGPNDLILSPFRVLVKVQLVTVIDLTSFSPGYFPKLPMLIPWPGPQLTRVMFIFVTPSPIEMQSSPVAILTSEILTLSEPPRWIPSVLGLLPGAVMLTLVMVTPWQLSTFKWNFLLSTECMSRIPTFFTDSSFNDCHVMWVFIIYI